MPSIDDATSITRRCVVERRGIEKWQRGKLAHVLYCAYPSPSLVHRTNAVPEKLVWFQPSHGRTKAKSAFTTATATTTGERRPLSKPARESARSSSASSRLRPHNETAASRWT